MMSPSLSSVLKSVPKPDTAVVPLKLTVPSNILSESVTMFAVNVSLDAVDTCVTDLARSMLYPQHLHQL